MSNALTDTRKTLAAALEAAGFRVASEVPQMFSPPLCWIVPRSPYRQQGQTFSRKKVSLSIVCLAAQGTNAEALAATDQMASDVADAVEQMDTYRLDTEEIGIPGLYSSAQGQEYVGAAVNVYIEVDRG